MVLKAREHSEIGTTDNNRGPKKSRAAYAPTKGDVKDNKNNDNNEAKDDTYPDSKAPVGRRGI